MFKLTDHEDKIYYLDITQAESVRQDPDNGYWLLITRTNNFYTLSEESKKVVEAKLLVEE